METDMQRAFLEFMLGGARPPPPSMPAPTGPQMASPLSPTSQHSKVVRKYQQLLGSFDDIVKQEWLETDDNLQEVVRSIATLRERCQWAYDRLHAPSQERWRSQGLREARNVLTHPDIEMSLHKDLLEHERMLAGIRKLLLSLQQTQEALGRRLEDLLQFHVDISSSGVSYESMSLEATMKRVDQCQVVYAALALELYRKQIMAEKILESTNDTILNVHADKSQALTLNMNQMMSEWSRKHRKSPLVHVDLDIVSDSAR